MSRKVEQRWLKTLEALNAVFFGGLIIALLWTAFHSWVC